MERSRDGANYFPWRKEGKCDGDGGGGGVGVGKVLRVSVASALERGTRLLCVSALTALRCGSIKFDWGS